MKPRFDNCAVRRQEKTMDVIEHADAPSFLLQVREHLMANEAVHNLLLSALLAISKNQPARSPRFSFYSLNNGSRRIGVALNVAGKRLLLSTDQPETAAEFASHLASSLASAKPTLELGGIFAADEMTEAFCRQWKKSKPLDFPQLQQQLGLVLEKTPFNLSTAEKAPRRSLGLCRTATPRDRTQLAEWTQMFIEEGRRFDPSIEAETESETDAAIRKAIENRQLFIWQDRVPVAMAQFGGLTPNWARVHTVFTHPGFRNAGYARSLVESLSYRLLTGFQKKSCFLLVQPENKAALRVYESLGYKMLQKFTDSRRRLAEI